MGEIIRSLDRFFRDGIFATHLRPPIVWLYDKTTFYRPLSLKIDEMVGRDAAWFAEFYQLLFVVGAFVLFVLSNHKPLFVFIIIWLGYRYWELCLFALNWLFVHEGLPHSRRRSLASFLLMSAEMVLLFAATYASGDCYTGRHLSFYNSLTTFVTIGPRTPGNLENICCLAVGMLEIVMAYSLTILVIGTVASVVVARRFDGAQK